MIIRAISDLHGDLPYIDDCDVLLLAGDLCPTETLEPVLRAELQLAWLRLEFAPWLNQLVKRGIAVIGIAGNHDFVFQDLPHDVEALNLNWTYLCDQFVVYNGIKFYGTPWVPRLKRWAFHATPQMLNARADAIPDDTDVLISHGPPEKLLDRTVWGDHAGDYTLNGAIKRVRPRLFVCGHIHEAHGEAEFAHVDGSKTLIKNVAYLDESYRGAWISRPYVT